MSKGFYVGPNSSTGTIVLDTGKRDCLFCGVENNTYQDICSSCVRCRSCEGQFTLQHIDDKIAEVRCLSCLYYRSVNRKLSKYKLTVTAAREKINVKQI